MIHGHGDDYFISKAGDPLNFSSNICHNAYTTMLKSYLCKCIDKIGSYPQPDSRSLRELAAQKWRVQPENILFTNGATEAIYLIAHLLSNLHSSILSPTFSEYGDACKIYGHRITLFDSIDTIPSQCDAVWICNPNNPTGKYTPQHKLLSLIESNPQQTYIIDQSYSAFAEGPPIDASQIESIPNTILIGSLTKAYAIPGLRAGYIVAGKELIQKLQSLSMPWSVNTIAAEAAAYILEGGIKAPQTSLLLAESMELRKQIDSIAGFTTSHSDTHFFLCKITGGTSAQLKKYLIEEHNILIRDASNFAPLDNSWIRIASQGHDKNIQLVNALKRWRER